MYCSNCGKPLAEDWACCPYCAAQRGSLPSAAPKKKPMLWVIPVLLLALAVGFGIGALVFRGEKTGDGKAENTEKTTVAEADKQEELTPEEIVRLINAEPEKLRDYASDLLLDMCEKQNGTIDLLIEMLRDWSRGHSGKISSAPLSAEDLEQTRRGIEDMGLDLDSYGFTAYEVVFESWETDDNEGSHNFVFGKTENGWRLIITGGSAHAKAENTEKTTVAEADKQEELTPEEIVRLIKAEPEKLRDYASDLMLELYGKEDLTVEMMIEDLRDNASGPSGTITSEPLADKALEEVRENIRYMGLDLDSYGFTAYEVVTESWETDKFEGCNNFVFGKTENGWRLILTTGSGHEKSDASPTNP